MSMVTLAFHAMNSFPLNEVRQRRLLAAPIHLTVRGARLIRHRRINSVQVDALAVDLDFRWDSTAIEA